MNKRIKVKVIPNAKIEKIENFNDGLKVWLRAKPVENAANDRLIEILAKHFLVTKSQIKVVFGKTNKNKVVEVG